MGHLTSLLGPSHAVPCYWSGPMKRLTHLRMRIAQAALLVLTLMIGVAVLGQESAHAASEIGAYPWSVKVQKADQSQVLVVDGCMEMPSHAHDCSCSECRSSAARPSVDGLRRPKEMPVPSFLLHAELLSVAPPLNRIAPNAPDNECGLLSGRDLLAQTARLLI